MADFRFLVADSYVGFQLGRRVVGGAGQTDQSSFIFDDGVFQAFRRTVVSKDQSSCPLIRRLIPKPLRQSRPAPKRPSFTFLHPRLMANATSKSNSGTACIDTRLNVTASDFAFRSTERQSMRVNLLRPRVLKDSRERLEAKCLTGVTTEY